MAVRHATRPHLIASLVIAVLLNLSGADGRRRGFTVQGDYEPAEYEDAAVDFDENTPRSPHKNTTYLPTNHIWSTTYQPTVRLTKPTTTPTDVTTSREVDSPKTARYDPYSPVLKMMTGSLRESDLEPSIDYYNEKVLIKEYNFDPMDLLKNLIDSANLENTPPAQFLEEMQNLISLQNRSKTEQDENFKGRDDGPKFPPSFLPEGLLKTMYDGWKNELKRLEKKYNVTSECTGPESITAMRLALMFPHFLNFGQKPSAVPSEIGMNDNNYNYNSYRVPSFFKRHEFGGLIPRWELNDTTRRVIIGTHLYALYRDEQNDMLPFRTKCMMLRWRMEKSVLSEDRRIRLLVNNDIISSDEQLLKTSLQNVFNNIIPSDFKNKIDWNLLGVSPLPIRA